MHDPKLQDVALPHSVAATTWLRALSPCTPGRNLALLWAWAVVARCFLLEIHRALFSAQVSRCSHGSCALLCAVATRGGTLAPLSPIIHDAVNRTVVLVAVALFAKRWADGTLVLHFTRHPAHSNL